MLDVHQHSQAQSFLDQSETWLLQKEVEHNIVLAISYLLTGENHFQDPIYLATVLEDTGVCGCIVCPPPDGLYLTELPIEAIPEITQQLQTKYQTLSQVLGPEKVATTFAKKWKRQKWEIHSRHRWCSLRKVNSPKNVATGSLRKAGNADIPLVSEWASAYAREVGTKVDTVMVYQLMVQRGLLHLWDDDGPRCVISASGLTPTAARISSLYTPPEYRGHGYAANAVASVSQHILNTGRQLCVAFTDINELGPTAIFQSLGYKPGEEFVLIHLD